MTREPLTWTELDPDTLQPDAKEAYENVQQVHAKAKAAREHLEQLVTKASHDRLETAGLELAHSIERNMDMTEDSTLYDDQQFEQLAGEYNRQKDRGLSGFVNRIRIFRKAHTDLKPERFDRFSERVAVSHRIERDLLHHFGRRLEELDSILGSQLEAYGVLTLLMANRSEFEAVTEHAALCSDHSRCLLGNFVDGLVSQVNRMKPGDPDKDIYGMTWKTEKLPLRAIDDE